MSAQGMHFPITASSSRHTVLLISLERDVDFEANYSDLIRPLQEKTNFKHAKTIKSALKHLDEKPTFVLVTDSAIVPKDTATQSESVLDAFRFTKDDKRLPGHEVNAGQGHVRNKSSTTSAADTIVAKKATLNTKPDTTTLYTTEDKNSEPTAKELFDRLHVYFISGGFLYLCCNFADGVSKEDMDAFLEGWDVEWRCGPVEKRKSQLSTKFPEGPVSRAKFPTTYDAESLYLKHVKYASALYIPSNFPKRNPAFNEIVNRLIVKVRGASVLLKPLGTGWLGYVGSVHEEGKKMESIQVVLAMCGL